MSTLGLPDWEIVTGASLSRVLSSEALIFSTKVGAEVGFGGRGLVSGVGSRGPMGGCGLTDEFSVGGRLVWLGFGGKTGKFWAGSVGGKFPEAVFVMRGEVVVRFRIV